MTRSKLDNFHRVVPRLTPSSRERMELTKQRIPTSVREPTRTWTLTKPRNRRARTLSPVFEQHWTHFDNFGGGGSDFNDPHSDDEIGCGDRSRFGPTAEEVTIPELVPPAAGEQSVPEEWKEDGLEPEELTREEAAALRWAEPDEDFDEGLAGFASEQGYAADRRTEANLGTPAAGSPPQRSLTPLAAGPSEVYPLYPLRGSTGTRTKCVHVKTVGTWLCIARV